MFWMEHVWILPALPVCAFFVLFLVGRFLPRGGDWLSIGAIGAVFVLFFVVLTEQLGSIGDGLGGIANSGFTWLEAGDFSLRIGWTLDAIAVVMIGVIATVGLMVNLYSTQYMRHHGKPEARYWWYFAVLSLFVGSMLALVLADNLLLLYVAWEGVGVCSFLLIGFYYERPSAVEAAKKAFITTRLATSGC